MKRRLRGLGVSAVIALLILGPSLTALAQGNDQEGWWCNGLNRADCALLSAAQANLQGVASLTVPQWLVSLNVAAGDQSLAFSADGSGELVLPAALAAIAAEVPDIAGSNSLQPLILLLQQFRTWWVIDVLSQFSVHLNVEDTLLDTPGDDFSGSAEVIFQDNNLYLRVESPTGADAWFGDSVRVTPEQLQEMDAAVHALGQSLLEQQYQAGADLFTEVRPQLDALNALVDRYVVTQRLPDAQVAGQRSAAFTTTLDLGAMLADPDLPRLIADLLAQPAVMDMSGWAEPPLNETQARFVLMTLGLMVNDATISVQEWVGLGSFQMRRLALNVNLALDLSLLGSQVDFDALTVNAILAADIADINQTTLDAVRMPALFHELDMLDSFLVGDASVIERELRVGRPILGAVGSQYDMRDVYAVPLNAGDTITLELGSAGNPSMRVYAPDGFEYGNLNAFVGVPVTLTAAQSGMYVVVVSASSPTNYVLGVAAG